MSFGPRVLSISADPMVFETRNRVLQSAGFDIVPCFRGVGALDTLRIAPVDAVVMGDSLDSNHKITLIQELRDADPKVAIIVVYPVGRPTDDVPHADAAVESLDGPEYLIRTLTSAIERKRGRSAMASRTASAGN